MTDIILHHYPFSPYSEKLRAMFGYLDMSWQSALTTEMPPRPLLQPLAGGYRKIPVAQIGADVFCDSKTISQEIAKLADKPELCMDQISEEVQELIALVEGDFFFASVLYSSGKTLNKKVLSQTSIFSLIKLIIDRLKMSKNANIKMIGIKQAGPIVKKVLPKIEAQLTQDFLFGDTPNIADFAAYHPLWFIKFLGEKPIINKYPKTNAWLERIAAFGEGNRTEISGEKALSIALSSQPRPIDEEQQSHDLIDKLVEIAPDDYGLDPSKGILKASTDNKYIIARDTKEAGLVHVHFPKEGYQITAAS